MTRSAVGDPVWTQEAAVRYDSANAPIPLYWGDTPGSGDVWASAHDVLRFGMMHVETLPRGTEPVLGLESIRAMHRDVSPADSVQWGMGWRLTTDRGYRVVDHGGGQPGVSTQLTLYPDEGLVIVVLCNRDRVWVQDVARRIAAAVLPRARAGADSTAGAAPPPPDLAGRWAGTVTTHEGGMPFALEIQPTGDIHASLGTLFITSLVQDVERSGGALTGSFYGVVAPSASTMRYGAPRSASHSRVRSSTSLRGPSSSVYAFTTASVDGPAIPFWDTLRPSAGVNRRMMSSADSAVQFISRRAWVSLKAPS